MKRERRVILISLCLVLLLSYGGPVLASGLSPVSTELKPDDLSVRLSYINFTSTSMTFTSSGIRGNGYVMAYPQLVDDTWVFLYLERYDGGRWVNAQIWSELSGTYYALCEGTAAAPKGYLYRIRAVYYAWSGSQYEKVTGYSGSRYY